jgi:UDP-N-acetylenolpyruvoylglucosamine reductase
MTLFRQFLVGHAAFKWESVIAAQDLPRRRCRARSRRSLRFPPQVKGVGSSFQAATVSSNQVIISSGVVGC